MATLKLDCFTLNDATASFLQATTSMIGLNDYFEHKIQGVKVKWSAKEILEYSTDS